MCMCCEVYPESRLLLCACVVRCMQRAGCFFADVLHQKQPCNIAGAASADCRGKAPPFLFMRASASGKPWHLAKQRFGVQWQ